MKDAAQSKTIKYVLSTQWGVVFLLAGRLLSAKGSGRKKKKKKSRGDRKLVNPHPCPEFFAEIGKKKTLTTEHQKAAFILHLVWASLSKKALSNISHTARTNKHLWGASILSFKPGEYKCTTGNKGVYVIIESCCQHMTMSDWNQCQHILQYILKGGKNHSVRICLLDNLLVSSQWPLQQHSVLQCWVCFCVIFVSAWNEKIL